MIEQASKLPWVTVITAVLNDAHNLETTIRSIEALEYPCLEYHVVDGGSNDGSVELIRRYEGTVIQRWTSEADNGIYDAMNKGWRAAREDSFILLLGAGDKLLSLPVDMGRFRPQEVIFGTVSIGERLFTSSADWRLKSNNTLHHQALLVHKSLHPEPPFDLRFKMYADFDFNQRLLKRGIRFVADGGFRASALPGGFSSRKDYAEMLRIVRKNFGLAWLMVTCLYLPLNRFARAMTRRGR